MITSATEYRQAIKALDLLRSSVLDLRNDVFHRNPRSFALMADGPLSEIARIQKEVDDFIGATEAESLRADVWLRLVGTGITWPGAATSVLTAFLENLRRSVQHVAEFRAGRAAFLSRPTAEMKEACDLEVLALRPGSLTFGVSLPGSRDATPMTPHSPTVIAGEALDDVLAGVSFVGELAPKEIPERLSDDELRLVVLRSISDLTPRPRGSVERVEFSGRRVVRPQMTLTKESRELIANAITKSVTQSMKTVDGIIREIDLDRCTMIIRKPDELVETRCTLPEDLFETARDALNRWTRVRGTIATGVAKRSQVLTVVSLEILEDPGA